MSPHGSIGPWVVAMIQACHGTRLFWGNTQLLLAPPVMLSIHTLDTSTSRWVFCVCVCLWEACTHLLFIFSTSTWFHRLAAVLTASLSPLPSFLILTYWECLCFSLKYIFIFPRGWLPSQQAYNISISNVSHRQPFRSPCLWHLRLL